MSYILGLTGGIATGKSHLSAVLSGRGAAVVDADKISHALTFPGGEALPRIRDVFGDGMFRDGLLDRKALGALVFSDPAALNALNDLMRPMLMDHITRELDVCSKSTVTVLDAPLLYEAGLDRLCREVWCAWIPKRIQLERLMARDGLTRVQALARMNSQMSAWEKRRRADRYIDTRGTLEDSAGAVAALYDGLLARLSEEDEHGQEN